jgi:nicotinamidase-related amidase
MAYVTPETLNQKTHEWLRAIERSNQHDHKMNAEHAGLLVIDMQNYFADPDGGAYLGATAAILPRVKSLIEEFRARSRPVIFTSHGHTSEELDGGILSWWWGDMCMEGTRDAEIHPDIAPLAGEKLVRKHRYSAFYNTDLETVLRCLNAEDLVITGVMTNICVDSTARDAFFRDHRVFIPADGTAGSYEDLHVSALRNLAYAFARVTNVDTLLGEMERK